MNILEVKDFKKDIVPLLCDILENRLYGFENDYEEHYVTDYYYHWDDRLGETFLHSALTQENPCAAFYEHFLPNYYDSEPALTVDDIINRCTLSKEEKDVLYHYSDDIQDWLNTNVSYYYHDAHFLKETVQVNLMLATDHESSIDMAAYNGLNRFSGFSGELTADCALSLIAEQFGKNKKLQNSVKEQAKMEGEYADRKIYEDNFVESTMQELENFSCCMGGLVFLVELSFSDFIKLKTMMKEGRGSITISENVTCGLFSPWAGSGSVLEINLPHEITVPASLVWDAWIEGSKIHGYDIDQVYGICSSAWTSCVELNDMD